MPFANRIPEPETYRDFDGGSDFGRLMRYAMAVAAVMGGLILIAVLVSEGCGKAKAPAGAGRAPMKTEYKKPPAPPPDLHNPVRSAPAAFPPDSNLPRGKEIFASGPIDLQTFNSTNDLVCFEDARVWFESDHDTGDDEDDHMIHRAVEVPLKRLVNLMEKRRATLKIYEAFRLAEKNKIHLATSLHCEGRAVDLTSDTMNLTELAKLAWQSGFDFVLYEKPRKSGVHVHCSMKRSPEAPLPSRADAEAEKDAGKSKGVEKRKKN